MAHCVSPFCAGACSRRLVQWTRDTQVPGTGGSTSPRLSLPNWSDTGTGVPQPRCYPAPGSEVATHAAYTSPTGVNLSQQTRGVFLSFTSLHSLEQPPLSPPSLPAIFERRAIPWHSFQSFHSDAIIYTCPNPAHSELDIIATDRSLQPGAPHFQARPFALGPLAQATNR